MNRTPRRQVLECASPLALSNLVQGRKSGRGLPQSKMLARQQPPGRGSWSQCVIIKPRRLSMNRPTPDPSQEGSRHSSASCSFPSWEELGVGSWFHCLRKSERRHSMLPLPVGFAQRLQASGCTRKSRATSVWRRRRDHRSAELQLRAKSIEPHPRRAGALRSALRKIVGVCVGFYGFCWIESLRQGVPLAAQRRGCAESDGSAPSSTWAVVRPTTLWCSGVGCGW